MDSIIIKFHRVKCFKKFLRPIVLTTKTALIKRNNVFMYDFCFASASVNYITSWTNVIQIQQEIMTYGPVTALMYVYENFMGYKKGWYLLVS